MSRLIAALTLLLTSPAFAATSTATEARPCSESEPACLFEALTRPEMTLLYLSGTWKSPDFTRDMHQYSAHKADRAALTIVWRQRLKAEARRLTREADGGQTLLNGRPVSRDKLGKSYFEARSHYLGGEADRIFVHAIDELGAPKGGERKPEVLRLGRRFVRITAVLGLQDLKALAQAAGSKEESDLSGRWLTDCLVPAGSVLEAARRNSSACLVP